MVMGFSIFIAAASSEYFLWMFSLKKMTGCNIFYLFFIFFLMAFVSVKFFLPKYLSLNIHTTPEYIEKRFDRKSSIYLTWLSLVFFILIKIVLALSVSSVFLQEIFKAEAINTLLFLVLLTGVLTLVGGLSAVIHIHLLQAVVLIIGTLYFSFAGNNIIEFNNFFNFIDSSITRGAGNNSIGFYSVLFVLPCFAIFSVWFWSEDQFVLQRIFSVRNFRQASKGILLGLLLILSFAFLFFNNILVSGGEPAQLISGNMTGSITMRHLYEGEKSLLLIGIYSFLMASLASIFHSGAALFTYNSYRYLNPDTSDSKLVLVGRLATTTFVVITLLLVPAIKLFTYELFLYIFGIMMILISPIVAVLLMSAVYKENNKRIAFRTLLINGILGLVLIITSPGAKSNSSGAGFLFHWNFFDFSVILFLLSCLIIGISNYLSNGKRKFSTAEGPDFSGSNE